MLRFGVRREARGVRCEKGERRFLIPAVLGKIEVHAADQVPGGISPFEKFLDRKPRLAQLQMKCRVELFPQFAQDGRGQILGAGHRGRRRTERFQLLGGQRGNLHLRALRFGFGKRTQCGHIARAEFPPITEDGWQRRRDLFGAELQEAVPGAARERLLQPMREIRRERRGIFRRRKDEPPVRREERRERAVSQRVRVLVQDAAP